MVIVEYAKKKDYTSLIFIQIAENLVSSLRHGVTCFVPFDTSLYMVCLCAPYHWFTPTAHFKLSNLVLRKDIKNHGNPTSHEPELVLNYFTTRLGNRVDR
ncbi:LOW QUALITY PROTEIN: hypothetical protein HID58_053127 [Brassica napus]|uniref:Brix domain-containing protein n=1 Tax=Brassica napus TaxID=3708 RepID=A0ABQ8AE82_BRANA|nr:LOW QUALITY PROTEIN: hypothetical protein HID58_053127 [Brassica napus]